MKSENIVLCDLASSD